MVDSLYNLDCNPIPDYRRVFKVSIIISSNIASKDIVYKLKPKVVQIYLPHSQIIYTN